MANSTVDSPGLANKFPILNKSQEKFNCLIHEMLIIREREAKLNVQSHSIRTPPHSLGPVYKEVGNPTARVVLTRG